MIHTNYNTIDFGTLKDSKLVFIFRGVVYDKPINFTDKYSAGDIVQHKYINNNDEECNDLYLYSGNEWLLMQEV